MPSDNNDIINRPFADLQERMAEVDRLKRSDDITNRREVDYRAICNYLNSEIFHLISSVDDPKVKAFVSFTKGEGFGRPLLEASLSEKIVIAPNWSGHLDFLNKNNSVLLPGVMTDVHKSALPKDILVEGAKWFTVNYQYASQVMMDVFKNNRKYVMSAKKQAMYNRVNFSMDKMTKDFRKILDRYLPKFEEQPQQVDLKLPKLKKVDDKPNEIKLPKLKKV